MRDQIFLELKNDDETVSISGDLAMFDKLLKVICNPGTQKTTSILSEPSATAPAIREPTKERGKVLNV